jgi:small neutral amino acid transporter SnatA (MarC family)
VDAFTRSCLLLFVLLNPFTMSVYLRDLMKGLDMATLARQLLRAAAISFVVFATFAVTGDKIFEDVLQVSFSSFQIFGGVTFLIIGIRLIAGSGSPVEGLEPGSSQVSGSIAMPFIVGPGTISASVIAGARLPAVLAVLSIGIALTTAMAAILLVKALHDAARKRDERLVQRYTEVAGRATALFTGSFAIEMILTGIASWLATLKG